MTDQAVRSQVTMVIRSMKSKIASAIIERVALVPQIKYVSFDRVRLLANDFKDIELPAVQLIDVNLTNIHEAARGKKNWLITLELVMKSNEYREISQQDLWNLEQEILRKMWASPNLGIPGVVQMNFLGSQTDLHLLQPYYFAKLDFEVVFYEDLVRAC